MTSAEIHELFDRTLVGDSEESEWVAVHASRRDGCRETFDFAKEWIKSNEPKKRSRAADVLARLRTPGMDPMFQDETYALIIETLNSEREPLVINSGLAALGHLRNDAPVPTILRFVHHPEKEQPARHPCPSPATRDEAEDVRDLAVFALGVLGDADSIEIREALLTCLADPDEDVREEAALGLGKRRDIRLLPTLKQMLDAPELKVRVAEAASALLGLAQDPPEWEIQDYKDAINKQFGSGP